MTRYREILRLQSLGVNHSQIAASIGCSRQTVISVLKKAVQKSISFSDAKDLPDRDIAAAINDGGSSVSYTGCRTMSESIRNSPRTASRSVYCESNTARNVGSPARYRTNRCS